jgi:hypothetical protein
VLNRDSLLPSFALEFLHCFHLLKMQAHQTGCPKHICIGSLKGLALGGGTPHELSDASSGAIVRVANIVSVKFWGPFP